MTFFLTGHDKNDYIIKSISKVTTHIQSIDALN